METRVGVRWHHIPTALDDLRWPETQLVGRQRDGRFLVLGGADGPCYCIEFKYVEFLEWCDETIYWSFCPEETRPHGFLSEVVNSDLARLSSRFAGMYDGLKHYVIHTNDVWEVLAQDFRITAFPTEDEALAAKGLKV